MGNSKCEVLSVLDLKDAFHSLRLSEKSKKYYGILPYFGSASYLYQRMPMGLNVSPPLWQSYINTILNCLESRKYCEAIMDDLLLFTPSKQMHMRKLEDLLKALLKNGLKISPRKYQLFKAELQYMGNTLFTQGKRVCVKPLHSQLEAIQKLEPPKTVKGCRSFAGMVNFLSIFCQDLQKLLKPIYDLTRKGRPFQWQQEQQTAFEEIKGRLQKPPILHLPDGKGRFHLYSDTSMYATGSALYQIQNGKPKLIAYASKRLPEAARNYSITELEMCGLAVNITSFAHLLKKVDFDAIVDHLALVHILKNKTEPATSRIKRLLKVLSAYSFNLYYMKGKDMILSDFLSRQEIDKSDPHEIIPISFDMKAILNEKYYEIEEEKGKYLVQTHSQAKDRGIKEPEVHGSKKGIDPNLKPEWLVRKSQKPVENSRIEKEGTDPLEQRNQVIEQVNTGQRDEIRKFQMEQSRENIPEQIYVPQKLIIPMYPNQISNPTPKLPERVTQNDRQADLELNLEINKDFKENSPYQEEIISEIYQRPHKSQIVDPPELTDLVNSEKIAQKYLLKLADIDKILKVIQRKVLRGTHLPITIKEIQAGYLNCPYFKDLYLYLSQNKLPSSKGAMHKIEALSEKYILLDSLLFKLNIEKKKAV